MAAADVTLYGVDDAAVEVDRQADERGEHAVARITTDVGVLTLAAADRAALRRFTVRLMEATSR